MTAYQRDLERIGRDLETLTNPEGTEQITRRVYRLYQHAALTGRLEEFAAAETALEHALVQVGPWPDLCLGEGESCDEVPPFAAEAKQAACDVAGVWQRASRGA